MVTKLREYIIENLKTMLTTEVDEWVDVYITPLNRIDITIVSHKADTLEEKNITEYVVELVNNFKEPILNNYSIGFIELFTVDDAEDLGIHQPEIKRDLITWSDVVNINKQKVEREKRGGLYKAISFYSYKGGVGRTTAMIQVAYLLAKQGRRVLLVDLDIEAPGLHRIFETQVNDETYGVKNGLVDYLFEKTMNPNEKDQKIKTTDLFCEISFDKPVSGSIYVLPATKRLDSQYIFKLTQLQTNIIYENRYLEDLLSNLEKEISIDAVLIDSRTGLNQWGAFSLLGFADQIVFITYPNEENIEGINGVIRLMQDAGLENYVVTMSKIVATAEGQKYSDSLFKKLNIHQEMPIDIPYNTTIAMADTFPVIDAVAPYKKLSDFIVENDYIDFNAMYLNKFNRNNLTEKIFKSSLVDIITDAESKILRDNNYNVVIYGREIGLKKLQDISSQTFWGLRRNIIVQNENGRRVLYPQGLFLIWDVFGEGSLMDSLIKDNSSSWTLKWFALILYTINQYIDKWKNSNQLKGLDELQGKKFEIYCQYLAKLSDGEILENIKSAILAEVKGFILDNDEADMEQRPTQVIHQAVSVFIDTTVLFNQVSGDEWLTTLINTIKILKKSIPDLRIVVTVNTEVYLKYEKEFTDLKGNILSLDWNEIDIRKLLLNNINMSTFRDYVKQIFSTMHHLNEDNKVIENTQTLDKLEMDEIFKNYVLNLIIGTRTICGKYSEPMTSWLNKQFRRLPYINSEIILGIIKDAADNQIKNKFENVSDRLISITSINESIEKFLINPQ